MGPEKILLILLVLLLLFGAKRIPEIAGSLGKGIREFKGSLHEIERPVRAAVDDAVRPRANDARDAAAHTGAREPAVEVDDAREPKRLLG